MFCYESKVEPLQPITVKKSHCFLNGPLFENQFVKNMEFAYCLLNTICVALLL